MIKIIYTNFGLAYLENCIRNYYQNNSDPLNIPSVNLLLKFFAALLIAVALFLNNATALILYSIAFLAMLISQFILMAGYEFNVFIATDLNRKPEENIELRQALSLIFCLLAIGCLVKYYFPEII